MKTVPFVKVVGSGNDFILIDGRCRPVPNNISRLAQNWCDRKWGIGADGLLLVLPSRGADARMRIFNSDGSEAEMCGNGLRCVAWYLYMTDHGGKEQRVETHAGLMQTQVIAFERTRIFLPPPNSLQLEKPLVIRGNRYKIHFVNISVPHTVLIMPTLEKVNVAVLGPAIRHHRFFQPAGTNVNFIRIDSPRRIAIRTYERGVETETLACGTGSVASVVIGAALGRLKPPVELLTAGGERLTVGFKDGRSFGQGAYLEGPARILFHGVIPL